MTPAELPIPAEVEETTYFCPLMVELAAHIGVRDTLRLCEAYGGRYLYLSLRGPREDLVKLLGQEKASTMCRIYGLETLLIPTARAALAHARRAPILRRALTNEITPSEAADMIGTSIDYVYQLLQQLRTGYARRGEPLPPKVRKADPRQIDLIDLLDAATPN